MRNSTTQAKPIIQQVAVKKPKKKEEDKLTWPQIEYGGMVKSSNQREVGLLSINGRKYLVQKGGQYLGIEVLNYSEKEIQLLYSSEEKVIKK